MFIPEVMQVATQRSESDGGAQRYFLDRRPVPQPGTDECLIRVSAAGLNGATRRAGGYAQPYDSGNVLGLEVSGIVTAISQGVSSLAIGSEVCALVPEGGYAEFCLAPIAQILPKPARLDLCTAGGIMENLCTAWVSLFDTCRLRRGERVLVHGGAGGLGLVTIQLATAAGIDVVATAGTDEKCRVCVELGASQAVNYRQEGFPAILKQRIGEVDAIVDIVGGAYFPAHMAILADGGRLCVIGLKGGSTAEVDFGQLMRRRLTITGSTVRSRTGEDRARIVREVHRMAWPLIESGRLRIVIDSAFPLSEVQAAHHRLESGEHIGKVLLVMDCPRQVGQGAAPGS